MNRVKFLVFALVALGLVGWSLKLAPTLGADTNARNASVSLAGVPSAIAVKIESRRSELQAAALRVGASNTLQLPALKTPKPDAPTADKIAGIRAAALEGASDALKAGLVVIVTNESGTLVTQGAGDAAAPPEGFDTAVVTAAGGAGALVSIFNASHLFYALPLVTSDKNEVKSLGTVAIGAPLLPDAKTLFGTIRSELGLSNIAVLADGKVVAQEGDKTAIEAGVKTVKAGPVVVTSEGAIESLGPVAFPMMSSLTQELALRRAINGTPFEVYATVSSTDGLVALAGFQKFGIGALIGLFLLSLAVTALLKSGEEEGAAMVMPPPMPVPPRAPSIPPTEPSKLEAPAPAPEASPDDFDFPPSMPAAPAKPVTMQTPAYEPPAQPSSPSSTLDEPAADPFENLAPAPAPVMMNKPPPPVQTANIPAYQPPPPAQPQPSAPLRTPSPPPTNPFDDEEGARTMAYPIFKPGPGGSVPPPAADPFAMAAGPSGNLDGEYNPDATRVAAVPAELIKQARQPNTTAERSAYTPSKVTSPVAAPKVSSVIGNSAALDEERHFQDVFREFVATREKCGEPADGLTYDKFKSKLLKNKEQLVQKYNCKSVRFQVYVKDGKAALKATPVKD